jgi:hypothetical protein
MIMSVVYLAALYVTNNVTGNGENYIMRSLMICTPYPILCGWLNQE